MKIQCKRGNSSMIHRLGRLGIIGVRFRRPFKYFLDCDLGILGDRIVFVMRVMELYT